MSNHRFDRTFSFDENEFTGLIFDCDGTLTDSMPLHYVSWRDTLARYEIRFDEDRFYAMGGVPSLKIVQQLAAEQGVEVDAKAVADEKENDFANSLSKLEPIESICDIARRNHGRRAISVASGGTRELVTIQLKHIEMYSLFEVIVCSEDTQRHKPEPDVFLEAARLMEIIPTGCCVFEDSDLGIEAAIRAEMCYVDIRQIR